METITRKRVLTKVVEDGSVDMIIYRTDDGREFLSQQEAQKHEDRLASDKLFKKTYRYTTIVLDKKYHVIHIDDLDKLDLIAIRHQFYKINCSDLKMGWNIIEIDDDDFCYSHVYDPDEIINEHRGAINILSDYSNIPKEP